MSASTDRIVARLQALAEITSEPGRMTRLAFSPEMRTANARVSRWLGEAGLNVRQDAAGNVIARLGPEEGPALALGSHLDTVRNGGIYDGTLGVLIALGALETLREEGVEIPCPVEILCFGDEEGVRFGTTVAGSLALSGQSRADALEKKDETGITLRQALTDFGLAPAQLAAAARKPGDFSAYIEVHIEQGPVLNRAGLPVAVVSAIAGSTRAVFEIAGEAGHAGTVPLAMRHDAFLTAAELALSIERIALKHGVLATTGSLDIAPGAINTIAGQVKMTLDLRSGDDKARRAALTEIAESALAISKRRGTSVTTQVLSDADSAPCAEPLRALLHAAARRTGLADVPDLLSGAGHDGAHMSALCDYAMLFVRCRDGISHNPAEFVRKEDIAAALAVLVEFLKRYPET